MVVFGQSGCIRAKVVVFEHNMFFSCKSCCIRAKWLYLGKSSCFRSKVVLFVRSRCIRAKVVIFRQSGCIRAKVFVFGQKWLVWLFAINLTTVPRIYSCSELVCAIVDLGVVGSSVMCAQFGHN